RSRSRRSSWESEAPEAINGSPGKILGRGRGLTESIVRISLSINTLIKGLNTMGGVIEPIINNKHPGGVMQKTIFQLAVILLALLESNAADYQFVSASPLLAGPARAKLRSVAVVVTGE